MTQLSRVVNIFMCFGGFVRTLGRGQNRLESCHFCFCFVFSGSPKDEINPGRVWEFTPPESEYVVTEVSQQVTSQLKTEKPFQ